MRIGRIRRLRLSSHFKNPAIWFGVLVFASGFVVAPALAQGPVGAAAVAAGAAAAATASAPAPAPKKTAASAALDAATMANSTLAQPTASGPSTPAPTEEASNAPAGNLALPAAVPGPPLTGVAAQCANLLKMAANLKIEVDKTTKDVLSVAVIRDAGKIEHMAKEMREQQH